MPDTIKQKNEDLHENVHQKQPPVVIAMARDYGAD